MVVSKTNLIPILFNMNLENLLEIKATSFCCCLSISMRLQSETLTWRGSLKAGSLFLTPAFGILLQLHEWNTSMQSPEYLFDFAGYLHLQIYFRPFSTLLWALGKPPTMTVSSEVLWLLASISFWQMSSLGSVWRVEEEKLWGIYYFSSLLTRWWVDSSWLATDSVQQSSPTGTALLGSWCWSLSSLLQVERG